MRMANFFFKRKMENIPDRGQTDEYEEIVAQSDMRGVRSDPNIVTEIKRLVLYCALLNRDNSSEPGRCTGVFFNPLLLPIIIHLWAMPVTQIPPELLQGILQIVWDDKLYVWERIHFMKCCPLVNREWRAMFDNLASRDVYIPNMQYLHYLLHIISTGRSRIYIPSHFASRTRHVIVQTVEPYSDEDYYSRTESQTQDHGAAIVTHSKFISQLAQCSFTGLHLCFPVATHIKFEAINTLDASPYMALRLRLDDRSTVTAEWRIDLGYPIQPQENWNESYRRQIARAVTEALDVHLCIDADGCPPDLDTACRLLRLEGDDILALDVSWEPEPFSGDWTEDLDLYFRRAVDGYYSFFIFAAGFRTRWLISNAAASFQGRLTRRKAFISSRISSRSAVDALLTLFSPRW